MEASYLNKLLKTGLASTSDPLEFNRVFLVNSLAVVSIAVLVIVLTINLFFGNFVHVAIEVSTIFFIFFILYLNKRGYYKVASMTFVNMCALGIVVGSVAAYNENRFTETENIFYAFLGVSIFLFDKYRMYIQAFVIIGLLVAIKLFKYQIQFGGIDKDFYLLLINTGMVCAGIFLFLGVFKGAFLRTLNISAVQERRLYSMIDNIPLFIGLMDTKGRYKVLNRHFEKAFGKERKDMLMVDPETFMMKDILDRQKELFLRALNGERPEFSEKRQLDDGSYYYARGKFIPIRDASDKITEVAIYVSNVTALEQAKEELELSNKNKSKLFSMVAHDIRSPLSLFEGLVSASKNKIISQEEFLIFQEKVIERFTPLQETINDLLNWSRVQMEDVGAYPSNFSSIKAIKDIASIYRELADQKQIELKIEGEDQVIFMDPNHFKMIIRNILHNALKFTPLSGTVSISIVQEGEFYTFKIKDSGKGMPPEMIEQIQNRELVRSQPGTMGESGTGLGLNLIVDLLEKNNCTYDIHAEDGKGTIFSFFVPVV